MKNKSIIYIIKKIINIKMLDTIIIFLTSFLIFLMYGGGIFHIFKVKYILILLSFLGITSNLIKYKKFFKIKSGLLVFLMIFLLVMLISLNWTNSVHYGFLKLLLMSLFIFVFFIIHPIINNNIKLFIKLNTFFLILYLFGLYIEYGTFTNIINQIDPIFRLGQDFSNFSTIGLSRYLGFEMINLVFVFLIFKNKKNIKLLIPFLFLLTILSFFYMFFSGTKGPILSLIFSFILYGIFNFRIIFSKEYKRYTIFFIFILLILFVFMSVFGLFVQTDFFEQRFLYPANSISGRIYLISMALRGLNISHILLGAGTGNFGYLSSGNDLQVYPHNIFIEILYENGIINLTIFLIMVFWVIKKNINNFNLEQGFLIILFYYFLINAQFSGDLFHNIFVFIFLILIISKLN